MKQTKHSSQTNMKHGRLFAFTKADEIRMAYEIKAAIRFMEKYGQGAKPELVDRRHYFQNEQGTTKTD